MHQPYHHHKMIDRLVQVLQIVLRGLSSLLQDPLFKMIAIVWVDQMNALYELGHRQVIDIYLCILIVVVTFRQLDLLQ